LLKTPVERNNTTYLNVKHAGTDTHSTNKDDVEGERDTNHSDIEVEEAVVLCQAVRNQLGPDEPDEVDIEGDVDNGKNDLADAVPNEVDLDVRLRHLQLCGDPDTVYRDVDTAHQRDGGPLHTPDARLVADEQGDAVNDDLNDLVERRM